MTNEEMVTSFNKFREICLKNAEDLLKAAKASLDADIEHASFHLSLLALEEIGKIEIEAIGTMSILHPTREPLNYNLDVEDHERKIFWALWGASFGARKQTKELIESDKRIAKNLHGSRLYYLYSDPKNPKHWSELMPKGEAKAFHELVEKRLNVEKAKGELDPAHAEMPDDLVWFFKIQEDEDWRKEIWGNASQEKLLEFGNINDWIKWLREVYEKNQKEMLAIAQKEMQREKPADGEIKTPKWRIRIEIITPSHSIRPKNLKVFNENSEWIKLAYKDHHKIRLEIIFSKNVQLHGLWEQGWGTARMFVAALNIATDGFFWWNIKLDPSRYYEEIWDLENNAGVLVEPRPLEINWRERRFVLQPEHLSLASLIFSYIVDCWVNKKDKHHMDRYLLGLSLLAKNDIHLRLEINSFEEFFQALKTAMIENGDWDQKSSFEEAYQKTTSWRFEEITDEMRKTFALGFQVEKEHQGNVDVTAVYAMKNYCEIYLLVLAIRFIEEKQGVKLRVAIKENS